MSRVILKGVKKSFGDFVALHELDLEIQEGEFLTLLGPSGCGKTTTLRLIAGFIEPTQGTILLEDEDVTKVAPQHREIGMVFQDYALFPHMTIADNIAFGLKERRYPQKDIDDRVRGLLDLIRLPEVHDRYPAEVSGGQQQRIAVARAVAYPPKVLLMDEPLGALDLKLRETMQLELRRIQQELGITTVYVTHDQTEAMNMSDRIVVMNAGRIEQMGGAEEIYNEPTTRFVADFVGQINLFDAYDYVPDTGLVKLDVLDKTVGVSTDVNVQGDSLCIGVRPEDITLIDPAEKPKDFNCLEGTISGRTFAGNLTRLFIDVGLEKPVILEAKSQSISSVPGEKVSIGWPVALSKLLSD
ncbi:MAG: ABC transporter ATP-binding protein [Pseudomonadota bacterium]|nr:ABC transporter ATP-binding protein [Pseudomonadota bacterium]